MSQFGGSGTGDALFNNPQEISINSTHIFVADSSNNRLQIFDLDGNYISQFGFSGNGDGLFNSPQGITINSNNVFVVDSGNHRIQIFDLLGNYISQFGQEGNDRMQILSVVEISLPTITVTTIETTITTTTETTITTTTETQASETIKTTQTFRETITIETSEGVTAGNIFQILEVGILLILLRFVKNYDKSHK